MTHRKVTKIDTENYLKKKKKKKKEYSRNQYRSMSDEDRQKLRDYRKNIYYGMSQEDKQKNERIYWKNKWKKT